MYFLVELLFYLRNLDFFPPLIADAMTTSTLWAGTNAGAIYVFTISLPKENRETEAVACQLGKCFTRLL